MRGNVLNIREHLRLYIRYWFQLGLSSYFLGTDVATCSGNRSWSSDEVVGDWLHRLGVYRGKCPWIRRLRRSHHRPSGDLPPVSAHSHSARSAMEGWLLARQISGNPPRTIFDVMVPCKSDRFRYSSPAAHDGLRITENIQYSAMLPKSFNPDDQLSRLRIPIEVRSHSG